MKNITVIKIFCLALFLDLWIYSWHSGNILFAANIQIMDLYNDKACQSKLILQQNELYMWYFCYVWICSEIYVHTVRWNVIADSGILLPRNS